MRGFTAIDLLVPLAEVGREQLEAAVVAVRKRVPGARGITSTGIPWPEILKAVDETHADLRSRKALQGQLGAQPWTVKYRLGGIAFARLVFGRTKATFR